ncbi:unnamed protein product, partial [marine sediment metagenome]
MIYNNIPLIIWTIFVLLINVLIVRNINAISWRKFPEK